VPESKTASVWNVIGTGVNPRGIFIEAIAAVNAANSAENTIHFIDIKNFLMLLLRIQG